jgi:energy-coupling factor transporter ATP-binding protein EcfA2
MLGSITLRNFTAFSEADFKFARGLNLIVGENGTGKTHILKAAYSAIYVSAKGGKDSGSAAPTKAHLQKAIASKLNAVFKPDELGRLTRRDRRGRQRCEVSCLFSPPEHDIAFSLNTASKAEVSIDKTPSAWVTGRTEPVGPLPGNGGQVMQAITEGQLTLQFPDDWKATKFDDWSFYRNQFQNVCGGAKAVDVLAVEARICFWKIEVKAYRQHRRTKTIELADEVAFKVREVRSREFSRKTGPAWISDICH